MKLPVVRAAFTWTAAAFLCLAGSVRAHQEFHLASPGGGIALTVTLADEAPTLRYAIAQHGRPVIDDARLGLEFKSMPSLGTLSLAGSDRAEIRETWERVYGKRRHVTNHANELTLRLKETAAPGREIHWMFRAYDDGVAFRYFIPDEEPLRHFAITAEHSEFRFLGNHTVWAADYGGFSTSHEAAFKERTLNELQPFAPYAAPLLVRVADDCWVTLTEANITDWANTFYSHSATRPDTLVTSLAPRWEDPTAAVLAQSERHSPWRVIMIGDSPGRLVESDLVQNLNAPCAIADPSWIKPGKAAWDRWWCGDYLPDANFKIGMNDATMKYFIDFAGEMGWSYQVVDWQWYGAPFDPAIGSRAANPTADITRPIPEVHIPELVAYAKSKGVRLFLWLEWSQANRQMDEAFALYEKWGIAGVKIDFMDRSDQEIVNFYHRCVKQAAEHHLLVDFHGAYEPDGWSRTYPNVITREGVMGNEYNKWSANIDPDHCLTLPFTRGLLGEMDFTPGGWRQKTKDTFRIVGGAAPGPFVMGTRCFQMAMTVVYESAFEVLCDSPYNYRASPAGLDFLKIVPTTWDDTKALQAKVGDYAAIARRSGDTWFIGAMTDWTGRTLKLPLDFLGDGEYEAEIWRDADEAADYPDRLTKETKRVHRDDTLEAVLASGGGYVAVLRRAKASPSATN